MEETQKIPIREVGAKDKEYPEKLCQYMIRHIIAVTIVNTATTLASDHPQSSK